MMSKLIPIFIMILLLTYCEESEIESTLSPISIVSIQFSQSDIQVQWEKTDANNFKSYQIACSEDAVTFELLSELSDIDSTQYTDSRADRTLPIYYRVTVINTDNEEATGPVFYAHIDTLLLGSWEMSEYLFGSRFILSETFDMGEFDTLDAGSNLGSSVLEWSRSADTLGFEHSLEFLPDHQYNFAGDSLIYNDTIGLPASVSHFSDEGSWIVNTNDFSLSLSGSQHSTNGIMRLYYSADTSILTLWTVDMLQISASILSPDSSTIFPDAQIQVLGTSSYRYTRSILN